jgi:hypothetical protein
VSANTLKSAKPPIPHHDPGRATPCTSTSGKSLEQNRPDEKREDERSEGKRPNAEARTTQRHSQKVESSAADGSKTGKRRSAPGTRGARLPREAREGAMHAWLAILHDRHPDATWVPASRETGAQLIQFPHERRRRTEHLPKAAA